MKTVHSSLKPGTPAEMVDELHHWGVKGMRWGVRRSKSKTGVGRGRAGAAQALMDESRRRNTAAKLGRTTSILYGFSGPKRQQKIAANQQEAAKRILAGKTTVKDFLRVARYTRVADLIITTTLKPGARDYSGNKPPKKASK